MKRLPLAALAAAFAAATFLPMKADAKTLRMGLLVSNKSLAYKAAEKLAEHVKEKTGGAYTIKLFPSQQLGSGKEMMQMLKLGTLDLYQGTNAQPTLLKEGRNFGVTAAPYAFRSQQEFLKFFDSPLFAEMVAQLGAGGVRWVGYMGARSPRAITTAKTPVRGPADMNGLKMRVPGSPPFIAFFKALGAIPTPMPFSEFFTAARTGLVEGQDNGIEVVYPRGLYSVQKYFSKTDHALGAWMAYVGEKKWQSWPDSLKKAVGEGMKTAAAYSDAELAKSMAAAFKGVREKGMTVLEVDKKPFIDVARKVWKSLDGTSWDKGFMDRVQKQLAEYRK
ncbi:MAG: TRAP transporter substrate-binding protein [Rhodospirillaceae bacterium]|nr:TRAP transporter substrate-binding protein [Rhodospirillaceae bacterium]MDE0617972.1 TRAP transporter substrate-binding protein [Rhodospirillaceae bacterium]